MRPVVVSEFDWRIVSDLAIQGDNPLGLGENGDETPTLDVIVDALLDLGERREAVAGALATIQSTCGHLGNGRRHVDLVTARLVAHSGLEPLMVAWLSAVRNGIHMTNENGSDVLEIDARTTPAESQTCGTMVVLAPDIVWEARGTMLVAYLPDAIVAAAAGRPLVDIVSHPVLDPLGLVIEEAELAGDDDHARLHVNVEHVFPSVDELAAMEPRAWEPRA